MKQLDHCIQSDTCGTQYYIQFIIQGVSYTKYNANYINKSSSMHGNVFIDIVSTNVKVLHHLGEESHNLNKLSNNIENKLSSIQKEHFNRDRCHIWSVWPEWATL